MRFTVGTVVCDCRFEHKKIVSIDPEDPDTATLEDGFVCSAAHCLDEVPHNWKHPSNSTLVKEFS